MPDSDSSMVNHQIPLWTWLFSFLPALVKCADLSFRRDLRLESGIIHRLRLTASSARGGEGRVR